MADDVLQNLVEEKLDVCTVMEWLSSSSNKVTDDSLFKCTRNQFVFHFIHYLRQRTLWLFNDNKNDVLTPRRNHRIMEKVPFNSSPNITRESLFSDSKLKSSNRAISDKTNNFQNRKSEGTRKCRTNLFPNSDDGANSSCTTSTPLKSQLNKKYGERFPSWSNKSNSSAGSHKKLTLGDFISLEPNSQEKKRKSRRITPTKLPLSPIPNESSCNNILMVPLAFDKFPPISENRQLLKFQCDSMQQELTTGRLTLSDSDELSRSFGSSAPVQSVDETSSMQQCDSIQRELTIGRLTLSNSEETSRSIDSSAPVKSLDEMSSIPQETSHSSFNGNISQDLDILLVLSSLYSFMIKENLCPNMMLELCFIAHLLVARECNTSRVRIKPFDTTEKCMKFAVLCCSELQDLFCNFNSAALSLLSTNRSLIAFDPGLAETFGQFGRKKRSSLLRDSFKEGGNVSFQCETDNVENFVGRQEFSSFRKQRDAFYQLLECWEKHRNERDWNFQTKLAHRVKSLIAICEEQTNLIHLARLFTNQLLVSCSKKERKEYGPADQQLLDLMPNADPSRLSRLQARLSQPKYYSRGPAPLPTFPAHEEFFRDFHAASAPSTTFNTFLRFVLLDELLRFCEMDHQWNEENESHTDEGMEVKFMEILVSTRLLAKFFGLCDFFPYQTKDYYSENVINVHYSIREKTQLCFDISKIIVDAYQQQILILAIPWIASYLAMIDVCSARLPSFLSAWGLLLYLKEHIPTNLPPQNRLLVQLTVDWVLDVAPVPSMIALIPLEAATLPDNSGVDLIDIVTDDILYASCPYLVEFNAALAEDSGGNVRHIRPITIQMDSTKTASYAKKQLEMRLEDGFLRNQSPSTRKCIQFVVERVASCCIKILCSDVISQFKLFNEENNEKFSVSDQSSSSILNSSTNKELIEACNEKIVPFCKDRTDQALKALLPRDLTESVITACCEIAGRQTVEKVNNWLKTHYGCVKELSTNRHDASLTSGSSLLKPPPSCLMSEHLSSLHELAFLSAGGATRLDKISHALQGVLQLFNEDKDYASTCNSSASLIYRLCIDIIFHLYICIPGSNEITKDVVKIVHKLQNKKDSSQLGNLLCVRNLWTVNYFNKCKPNAWLRLVDIFIFFVNEKLLSRNQIKMQLETAKQKSLPQEIFDGLGILEVHMNNF